MTIDAVTKQWIRNTSDELAAENGCFFDVERGAYAVWWIERYCRLYEGEWAGENILLRSGIAKVDKQVLLDWDDGGRDGSLERAKAYAKAYAEGHLIDWQYECTMRLFGWARHSDRWNRNVRRFSQASIWIAKKNKKTPTLAAWGVYLTCGDGELGAKCFGGAKDGNQAGLAMAHAIAMIEQSPELSSECRTNKNEKSITHEPTRSIYKPLSSANERNKNAKEGINGHILIDETHVVDQDFIDIISRAGISRAEPMRIEVSTAGQNPDGYGKKRQDYARQVIAGAEHNDALFVAIYEAPQNIDDDELARDPVTYGKMANPSWGHTAHEEEYLADYNESRRTITGLAKFKLYRLNIWQRTENHWLRGSDWLQCGRQLNMVDFRGKRAALGVDLSKTRDMSAVAIAIPGEPWSLFTRLWITEAAAEEYSEKADFEAWAATGELVKIPGEIIEENFIREEIEELMRNLQPKVLVYDRTYAADLIDWAERKYGNKLLLAEYPQSSAFMEKPIDDFEADVIERKMQHPNNRCLNWQAGHATVVENFRGHRIIKKPKQKDYRKVDGMVAAIMARWGMTQIPRFDSVYQRRGVITA
jgi:phage terminase large subunit-like protein